jgi:FixJ family two-component response regulator
LSLPDNRLHTIFDSDPKPFPECNSPIPGRPSALPPLIAVLDDEPQFCKAVARLLNTHGFDVVTFTSGEAFLADCAAQLPDCLLLDLHMPDLSGFEVLERIATGRIPSFVITGHDQPATPNA